MSDFVTKEEFENAMRSLSAGLSSLVSPIASRVRAVKVVNQSISANTRTVVSFTSVQIDTLSEFSTTTHRFTAKESGIYAIHTSVWTTGFDPPPGTIFEASIFLNGTVEYARGLRDFVEATIYRNMFAEVFSLISLARDDYIDIRVFSNASIAVLGISNLSYLEIFKLP